MDVKSLDEFLDWALPLFVAIGAVLAFALAVTSETITTAPWGL